MKIPLSRARLEPTRIINILSVGLVIGIIDLFIELSFAALIFSGPLAGYIQNGFGMMLVAAVLIGLVVTLWSSFTASIALPQDVPVAIFALISVSIMQQMRVAPPDAGFATVVAAIMLTSLLTGILFFLIGRFHLSVLARFVPFPVIGGFLAGTGFLLVRGAFGVVTNIEPGAADWTLFFSPALLLKWVPALAFGVLFLFVLRRTTHYLVMPLMVVGGTGLFYAALFLTGMTLANAAAAGHLAAAPNVPVVWQPMTPQMLSLVNFQVIAGQWDKIATVMFISVIGMLLNVSGLELVARRDFDLDRELQAAGLANLFGGAVGGTVGYHALSLSALALRTGGKQRAIGLVSIGVLLGAVVLGTTWFALVPRAILGGVLFFLGLSFLVEWLYDAWFKISRADYALIVAIVAVIATIGFLEGVVLGIAIAMVLFVVNYSRIHVVNYALTGLTYRSTVDRSPAQRATLRAHGDELLILQLQEFIFFGTAQRLLEYLQTRLNDHTRPALHFVVLDFRRVPGLDSSAVISFVRLKQLTEAEQVQLVLTHLSAPMQEQLLRGQVLGAVGGNVHTFPTLDHGVEWCENEMLQRAGHGADEPELLATQLQNVLGAADGMARLIQYMEFSEVPGGTRLIQQGDAADALYFIEYGSVSVELQLLNGKKTRLRTIRRGCVVGEVAMYTQGIRTASVETLEPSGIYRLSADALRRMETEEPMIASAVHKWVAQQIAERLSDNVRTLEVVMH